MQSSVQANTDRISPFTKIAYGIGSANDMWGNWLYPGLVWTVFNMYLGVSPFLISLALTLRLISDAITDPLFGWLSDNTRTRFGRRRPFILVGSLLSGLCLPVLFMAGDNWTDMAYFWYMLLTSAVYMAIVSSFNMPYQSLGPELTPDYNERTSVYSYKAAIQKIFEVALFAAGAFSTAKVWQSATVADVPERLGQMFNNFAQWLPAILGSLFTFNTEQLAALAATPFGWEASPEGELPNVLLGAQVYTSILGVIMMIIGIVVFFTVKERNYEKLIKNNTTRVKITETLGSVLKCAPFRPQLVMAIAYALGTSMLGTLGLYATNYYVCQGNISEGALWNFGMGLAGMVLGFTGAVFYAFLSNKRGKTSAMRWVQISAIAVFIASWWLYNPDVKWLQFFVAGFIAFTGAGFWVILSSIGADVVDYDEWENGNRREGAFSACTSYILKCGMVLGTLATGSILSFVGFDAALGGDQSESTIFWIRFLFAAIPIIGLVVALVALKRFPLSQEKMLSIRQDLESRRGKV